LVLGLVAFIALAATAITAMVTQRPNISPVASTSRVRPSGTLAWTPPLPMPPAACSRVPGPAGRRGPCVRRARGGGPRRPCRPWPWCTGPAAGSPHRPRRMRSRATSGGAHDGDTVPSRTGRS
jgi:hypothetical protein